MVEVVETERIARSELGNAQEAACHVTSLLNHSHRRLHVHLDLQPAHWHTTTLKRQEYVGGIIENIEISLCDKSFRTLAACTLDNPAEPILVATGLRTDKFHTGQRLTLVATQLRVELAVLVGAKQVLANLGQHLR